MIIFAVKAFESMEAWLILFYFKIKGVSLEICFAIPDKMSVILDLVRSITFNILWVLSLARKIHMSPLLAILALENIWVHIYILYGSDVTFYIEAIVDKSLCKYTILEVPNINGHVWFG